MKNAKRETFINRSVLGGKNIVQIESKGTGIKSKKQRKKNKSYVHLDTFIDKDIKTEIIKGKIKDKKKNEIKN